MKKKSKSGKSKKAASKPFALKRTAAKSKKVADLKYFQWNDVELETLNPLLQRQLVVGHEVMLARVLLKKGCVVPMHSHVNEQLTYILVVAMKFLFDGLEYFVHAGVDLTILPNISKQADAR